MNRRSQQGVALVVTLIMLSVITVMTVAFLALTRRERASVTQAASASETRLMADAALERAKGIIVGQVLATTNFMEPDLIVSRNFISTRGFDPNLPTYNPDNPDLSLLANVNYEYTYPLSNRLSADQILQNIANLYFDPRPPVFIRTNRNNQPLREDFRFWVDLNRNGRFETNGVQPDLDNMGRPASTNFWDVVGDPEFIGVLEQPLFPHSRTNRFVGRYAFLVQPVGKSLDANFIHNHGKSAVPTNNAAYFRNQGHGSWEINLAAFLAELNTNRWDPVNSSYFYNTNPTPGSISRGVAFDDAQTLMNWRYNGGYQNLESAIQVLGVPNNEFESDGIDAYANGPLYLRSGLNDWSFVDNDQPNEPWPGADSLSHFYTLHDFWFTNFRNFIFRMDSASDRLSTYERYTFYRMLAQLGTDSASEAPIATPDRLMAKLLASRPDQFPPEPVGKVNLNYNNLNYDRRIPGADSFVDWTPIEFFTNVANVLLRAQFNFGITNIPISPTNYYTPAVHRLLQLTANLYDSTTSNKYPSVFRPIFTKVGNTAFISDYEYLSSADVANLMDWVNRNPYGIPLILGAKKGFPNFNEYVFQTAALATRKLDLVRANTNSPPYLTNEMYILNISNFCGVEFWNSYLNPYTNANVQIYVNSFSEFTLTNRSRGELFRRPVTYVTNITVSQWPGFPKNNAFDLRSFVVPMTNQFTVLPESVYRPNDTPVFEPVGHNVFEESRQFIDPEWVLNVSNRFVGILYSEGKIIDFVYLENLTNTMNIVELMRQNTGLGAGSDESLTASCFDTNRNSTGVPEGIVNQLNLSLNNALPDSVWLDFNYAGRQPNPGPKAKQIESFNAFVYPGLSTKTSTNLHHQAPFSPVRKVVHTVSYQANDPLVHHMVDHLQDTTNNVSLRFLRSKASIPTSDHNLGSLNARYSPWGGSPKRQSFSDPSEIRLSVKDPGVKRSDDWDFPTNKFPNVGWVGRVHRGTPWQTVYLKSEAASALDWAKQFLDPYAHPTNDWRLIDIFTVAVHPNASHGQLSINQTNVAAWAAVLGGVTVMTNIFDYEHFKNQYDYMVIEPASSQMRQIIEGINHTRATFPGGTWRRLGELMAVPELTVASPYLDKSEEPIRFGIDDAAIERIPQQILSLLKVGDARFVIYSFGQALKPAENSIVTSGSHVGICTNYQITGEMATRAVLRLEGTAGRPRPVLESYNILPLD